jgi:hypothetical protein
MLTGAGELHFATGSFEILWIDEFRVITFGRMR